MWLPSSNKGLLGFYSSNNIYYVVIYSFFFVLNTIGLYTVVILNLITTTHTGISQSV